MFLLFEDYMHVIFLLDQYGIHTYIRFQLLFSFYHIFYLSLFEQVIPAM